jgi:hypothetical protein
MKTVHLQIDDKNYEAFLSIINNLKDGFIQNFNVDDTNKTIDVVSDKEQHDIEKILNSLTDSDKEISHKKTLHIDV